MQFKVPQDVQRADTIVGPLTLRQLLICSIGFALSYAVFTIVGKDFQIITAIIPCIIIALITITVSFIRPLDLNFEKFMLYKIASYILPKKRYWLKGTGEASRQIYTPPANTAKQHIDNKKADKEDSMKKKSLSELSKILDQK